MVPSQAPLGIGNTLLKETARQKGECSVCKYTPASPPEWKRGQDALSVLPKASAASMHNSCFYILKLQKASLHFPAFKSQQVLRARLLHHRLKLIYRSRRIPSQTHSRYGWLQRSQTDLCCLRTCSSTVSDVSIPFLTSNRPCDNGIYGRRRCKSS